MQQLVLNAGRMGKVNRPHRHSRLALPASRRRARKTARQIKKKQKRDTGIRMVGYLKLGLAYLGLAIVIVFLTRAAPVDALLAVWTTAVAQAPGMTQVAAGLLGLSMVQSMLRRPEGARQIVVAVIAALIGTLAFHSAFGLIKTSMPYIVPFWADPMLAELDRLLHLGVDPWRLGHDLGALLPMEAILPAYLSVWAFPALCVPVFLAAFDKDVRRVRRFMVLYVLAWAFVGNVLALVFNSAGPIFYDRLLGADRFAEMIAVLEASPLAGTNIPTIQQNLWTVYVEKGPGLRLGDLGLSQRTCLGRDGHRALCDRTLALDRALWGALRGGDPVPVGLHRLSLRVGRLCLDPGDGGAVALAAPSRCPRGGADLTRAIPPLIHRNAAPSSTVSANMSQKAAFDVAEHAPEVVQ